MGRKPGSELKYWTSKGGYFVNIEGERICLAKGEESPELLDEAQKRLHWLLATRDSVKGADRQPCFVVLNEYSNWLEGKRKDSTIETKRYYLQLFVDEYGDVVTNQLNPQYADRLIRKMEKPREVLVQGKAQTHKRVYSWGHASRQAFITTLHAVFAWAEKNRLISSNPLRGMERKGSKSRGKEAIITEEDHQKLLAAARSWMHDLLIALNDTGARPGAIYCVEASDLQDLGNGTWAWVGTEQKRERYNFPAVVYLTDRVVEMHRRLSVLYPAGPIFRNRLGRPWNDGAVDVWFQRQRAVLGLNPKICPYSYRHKFATEWLLAGNPIAYLAELQNTSIRMIELHYGHLREHGVALRTRLVAFRGQAGGAQGQPDSP